MAEEQQNLSMVDNIENLNIEGPIPKSEKIYGNYFDYETIKKNTSEKEKIFNLKKYKEKNYICKSCSSFPLIKMIDQKSMLLICKNHKDEIEIKEFITRVEKDNENKDINENKKCKNHGNDLIKVCINCKQNLCDKCDNHNGHQIKSYKDLDEETKYMKNFLRNYANYFYEDNPKENKTNNVKNFTEELNAEVEKQNNLEGKKVSEEISELRNERRNVPFDIILYLKALITIVLSDLEKCPNYIHYENIKHLYYCVGEKLDLEYYSYFNESKLKIRLFGKKFVENNKKNCSIIINGEIKELIEEYQLSNPDTHLYLKLVKENNITDMSYMFYDCDILRRITENSKWKTDNVTNMSYMFYNCEALVSLPEIISKWKTHNVTDMSYMFYGCKCLLKIPDISKWETNKVNNMSNMFNGCELLQNLKGIGKWNTINVENMYYLFGNCKSLEELNVFPWDTSNVTDMSYMFYNCLSLNNKENDDDKSYSMNNNEDDDSKLEIKWKTNKVINMSNMFNGCEKLESLPKYISEWDVSQVQYMSYMFSNCKSLKSLPDGIIDWKTGNVLHMNNMFENCSSLEELPDITNWNIDKLGDINNMFEGCNSLKKTPNFSKWNNNRIVYKEGKLFEKYFGSNKDDYE